MTRLMDDVFTNYNKEIRPARATQDTVTVSTTLFLLSIIDVDEVSGSITLSGGLSIFWIDFRLSWQPADYGGLTYLMVNSSKVWTPHIFLLTSSAEMEKFSLHEYDIRIHESGLLSVSAGKLIRSSCTIDMTNFPLDSQTCSLVVIPWGYLATEINLTYIDHSFETRFLSPNGEWDIESKSSETVDDPTYITNAVAFNLGLKRKSAYFVISMVLPVYILCFLNPFVFLLPAASGERISFTITMFLSLAVYMTLVGDNMPKVSEPMAGISYFLLVSMIYSCVLIILTIFTLRWHARNDASHFPKWLRRFVLLLKKKDFKITEPSNHNDRAEKDNYISGQNGIQHRDINIELYDGGKKNNFLNNPTNLEKEDVVDLIDNALFVISEIAVVGMIFGFTYGYYR
ncbi:neuronal acetylcholine receptor subunit alpha-2-like [Pecten maximus]|uniref:neuronal acetylcholine receptor subunit alpha-2-like n=1 Tax=Pecten maximus TaxID=6579 RepID=UPI001458471D|nr:neuronal acetylcholine receptor subunit alpha-2-like [Pecten maximus]